MCGLTVLMSKRGRPVGQRLYQIYHKQRHRGREGYGYMAIDSKGKLLAIHRAKTEDEIKKLLMKEQAEIVLFHHRLPTSTKNTLGTTHPIRVSNKELKYDYYFAHNGIITNKDTLKAKHEELGYEYNTEFTEFSHIVYNDGRTEEPKEGLTHFNDSESLAIELARFIEGLSPTVATVGGVAFWGVQIEKGSDQVTKVFFGKNKGRDLKTFNNKKYWGLSSETGDDCKDMFYTTIDLQAGEVYENPLPIDEAKPAVTRSVGYGSHSNVSANQYASVSLYNALENKEYTRDEALDTGVPLSEFFSEERIYGRVFIPVKFAQQKETRVTQLSLPPGELDTSMNRPSPKIESILEDLCTKYVTFEYQKDMLDSAFESHSITAGQYKKETRRIERQMQEIDDKISAFMVDDEYLEEMYSLCRDMVDYNSTYYVTNDEIEYVNLK